MKKITMPLQRFSQHFHRRWNTLEPREQLLLLISGGLLGIGILYWGIWHPLQQHHQQAQIHLKTEQQLLQWVQKKADEVIELRNQTGITRSTQPLNQIISESVERFEIELIRLQPQKEEIQVYLQPVPFNKLLSWIYYLKEEQGVDVVFIDMERGDVDGVVNVNRLQLK